MNENKRPSVEVTDKAEAEGAKPQKKKTNKNQSLEECLKEELGPHLEVARNDDVKNLAKNLFAEMWKINGEEAATAIAAPFFFK